MGSYLQGADIHDFLSCLGKHAVENAAFGFSSSKTKKPECYNIVFVEDTDELAHCADGFGLANKEAKKATPGEWGESIQKEEDSGWGMEPDTEVKNDAIPADTGWAVADDAPVDEGGWGCDQVAVSDNGWDSTVENEVDRKAPAPFEGGWTDEQAVVNDNGWDSMSKSDVNTTAPAARSNNWDSMEGQNPPDGGQKGKLMHPSRRLMNAANDSTENHGVSERRSGSFEPTGTNTVPLGRRRNFAKAGVRAGSTEAKLCEEKEEDMGWGTCGKTVVGDDFGWGSSTQEEGKTYVSTTQQGASHDNWASQMDCETLHAAPASQSLKNDSPGRDAWQERETTNMNDWGHNDDWNCKDKTAPTNPPDSWNAMQRQHPRKGGHDGGQSYSSKRIADITDLTEKQCADERRSGKFEPSGSNTVPLGKRRSSMKPDIEKNSPDSMMMKNNQLSEAKEDQMGWANCEQTMAVDDMGKGNWNTHPEGESTDGWGFAIDGMGKGNWNTLSEGKSASADPHGWGSEVQIVKSAQDDGWGDMNSDAPSNACNNITKLSRTSWDCGGFNTFDTEPSRGHLEEDGPPRPRKKFNRGPTDNSWAGFASTSPELQSRRSRLRALINMPAYSELNELYKVANKILHHNEYQPGDKLNPEDDKFILEKILVHHRDKEEKVGCGVDYIMIDYHTEHQVSCFWVVRKDGSKTDFSYWKCLEGLFETKYSQGDTVKEEVKDGWNCGANSAAPTTSVCDKKETKDGWDMGLGSAAFTKGECNNEGTQNSWDMGTSSAAFTKGECDKEGTQNSRDMGASSAATTKSMCDQVETKDSWDMGAVSAAPPESMCDNEGTHNSWNMGASSAATTKSMCDQVEAKDSRDMGAGFAAPLESMHDNEGTENSWDLGASSAAFTKGECDKEGTQNSWDMEASSAATTKSMCDQVEAKGSWDMGAGSAAPLESMRDQIATKGLPEEGTKDGWEG